jgi:release factor glutamine methyltransferase
MSSPMDKALDYMRKMTLSLLKAGIPEAEKESEMMITEGAGVDRVSLYRDNPALSEAQRERLGQMLMRRTGREPLQYIIGHVYFYGIRINVGPGVLIPRPESELVVEEALRGLAGKPAPRVLDLCTGSGCLALAIARNLPGATVRGTDLSVEALRYAEENARLNRIENAAFLAGHLFDPVRGLRFEAVVSNPPYVRSSDIEGLEPEIRHWEPRAALDGGQDGLDLFREILPACPRHLQPKGFLLLEMGQGQARAVAAIAERSGLEPVSVIKDLAGVERVMVLRAR